MSLKEFIMTVKAFLYIQNPQKKTVNFLCEFKRVPTIGEYITLDPKEADFIKSIDSFKVVYVVHSQLVDGSQKHTPYDAYIYAVKENHDEALEASGFYS